MDPNGLIHLQQISNMCKCTAIQPHVQHHSSPFHHPYLPQAWVRLMSQMCLSPNVAIPKLRFREIFEKHVFFFNGDMWMWLICFLKQISIKKQYAICGPLRMVIRKSPKNLDPFDHPMRSNPPSSHENPTKNTSKYHVIFYVMSYIYIYPIFLGMSKQTI